MEAAISYVSEVSDETTVTTEALLPFPPGACHSASFSAEKLPETEAKMSRYRLRLLLYRIAEGKGSGYIWGLWARDDNVSEWCQWCKQVSRTVKKNFLQVVNHLEAFDAATLRQTLVVQF